MFRLRTSLAACAAATALFAVPTSANAGTLSVHACKPNCTSVNLLSSPALDCPSSAEYNATGVTDAVWIVRQPEGIVIVASADDTGGVAVMCANNA